jgi:hypothetical protein
MRLLATVAVALVIAACASTPERPASPEELQQQREELATKRFDECMEATLPKFVLFHVATADQRLKAAEVCKSVMSPSQAEPISAPTGEASRSSTPRD